MQLFREQVNGLWIGDRLTTIQRLSIESFLYHGHPFHLYIYGDVAGVPHGTTLRRADDVIPASEIFTYQRGRGAGSFAGFSDVFRYKLLFEQGGWWVDTDTVVLRPLEFEQPKIYGWESQDSIGTAIMRVPRGCELMGRCYEESIQCGKDFCWGDIGPRLFTRVVHELNLADIAEAPASFYPISWKQWMSLLASGYRLPSTSHTIHLWHHVWLWHQVDTEGHYARDSVFERLKRVYLKRDSDSVF